MGELPGEAGHAAALASPAGCPSLDLFAREAGKAAARVVGGSFDPSSREGESALGVPANCRRAQGPGCHGVADDGAQGADRGRLPASTGAGALLSWRAFMRQQAATTLACDFLTVETAFLQRIYVLFFISLATRRIEYVACSSTPDGGWTAQQARNLMMQLGDEQPFRLLIHDRDTKFGGGFDEVFRSEGIKVIRTPVRAPNANAYAERWVRTVRGDCLDRILIAGRRNLERVLRVYVRHYNEHRPHRALRTSSARPLDTDPAGDAAATRAPPRSSRRAGPRIRSGRLSSRPLGARFAAWSCAARRRCSIYSAAVHSRSANSRRPTTTGF
jgi:transposase InsO family protein